MNVKENLSTPDQSVALTYFTDFQARTVEAISERIIPGDAANAGATRAGVVYYIDRAIAGFSAGLQRVYRLGLHELEAYCRHNYTASFVDLAPGKQDDVVRCFFGAEIVGPSTKQDSGQDSVGADVDAALLKRLFAIIREHTLEGFFCDPVYGGNRDAVGWRLVGFPGVHWGYTAEQMQPGYDGRKIPTKTLSDLRRELKSLPGNDSFTKNDRV